MTDTPTRTTRRSQRHSVHQRNWSPDHAPWRHTPDFLVLSYWRRRQGDAEGGALSWGADDRELATVRLHERAG